MLEGFEYQMSRWLPFQDRDACRRARAIKREDFTRHPNPDFKIRIVKDHEWRFGLLMDIFGRIKRAAEAGSKLVLILPQPDPYYAWVAVMCNRFRVSCRYLYTFDMDEYADKDGRIAPETWRPTTCCARCMPISWPPSAQHGPTRRSRNGRGIHWSATVRRSERGSPARRTAG